MQIFRYLRKHLAILYFIIGFIWLIFSGMFMNLLTLPNYYIENIEFLKGLLFVIFTSVLIHIIIKKHESYKRVEENEQELTTLINSMPDFISFKDVEGRYLRINDFGVDLYQLKEIDYRGKTDEELSKDLPFFKEALLDNRRFDQETLEKGKLTRAERSVTLPSGDSMTFDVINVPVYYENGQPKGLVRIGRDISQLKAAETMLLRKEKLSVVGELAAGIAHEIRNPLTTIKGFIQLMQETSTSFQTYFPIILKELERINEIVSELLIFSKPQSRIYEPFQFNKLLEYLKNLASHDAILNNVDFTIDEVTEELYTLGDINQLIQVFLNVIRNAIDAMPHGGCLKISLQDIGETNFTIAIIDNGIGIPSDRLSKLGEPFFTLKEKGMGLGLTMSNKILQEHKGSMSIESTVGKGTTVNIKLPRFTQPDSKL